MGMLSADMGWLAVRVMTGLILLAHGILVATMEWNKPGLAHKLGFRPPGFWQLMGWAGQAAGGVLVTLGLALPLGCALTVSAMGVAVVFKWNKGFWNPNGGYEYALFLSLLAIVLALVGPGPYTMDRALGWDAFFRQPLVVLPLLAGGVVAAALPWVSRRRPAGREQPGAAAGR